MEIFLIKLLQFILSISLFILSISLLVLLHEGGHALASKLFGVRVEKFFIFFDVSIGKWSGKLFSFKPKNSETEYGMGWLPLGGYCKIAGMIDESMDTEQMKRDPQPWEFRTKPAWQRLIIMVAGVTVNFVLALFIYSMIMFHWGESYVRVADMSQGMKFNTEAKQLGFRDHDILVGTDRPNSWASATTTSWWVPTSVRSKTSMLMSIATFPKLTMPTSFVAARRCASLCPDISICWAC